MNPLVTIHDSITGQTVTREMTDEELATLVEPTIVDVPPPASEETPTEEPTSEE